MSNNEILDAEIKKLQQRIHEPFTSCINPIAMTISVLKEMKDDEATI